MTPRAQAGVALVLCLLAWGLFTVRIVVPSARNPNTNGFVAYYTEARVLLENHRDLPRVYDDRWLQGRIDQLFDHHVVDMIHAQPPPMSLIMAPVAWLSPARARVVWTALSLVLWVAGLAALVDALGIRNARLPPLALLGALTTIYTPLADNLRRGQSYVLLFFVLCLAIRISLRSSPARRWSAGVPLGLMMLLKGAGLWLWPLLLVARQGRLVLAGAATIVAGALASSPLIGWEPWRSYFHDYRWLASDPTGHVTAYQTVTSLVGHLFVLEPTWNPTPLAHLPRLAAALTALVTVAAFVGSARAERLGADGIEERALSLGLFVSLMVSVAPRAEGYHYVLVFPALVIAFWWAARGRASRRAWAVLLACAALICVPQSVYGSPRLEGGWRALLAYPRLYGAFGLWGWLALALRRFPREALDSPIEGGQRTTRQ